MVQRPLANPMPNGQRQWQIWLIRNRHPYERHIHQAGKPGLQRVVSLHLERPHALESNVTYPSIADKIGADNLTVESQSVDEALNSLKKVLPDIKAG